MGLASPVCEGHQDSRDSVPVLREILPYLESKDLWKSHKHNVGHLGTEVSGSAAKGPGQSEGQDVGDNHHSQC